MSIRVVASMSTLMLLAKQLGDAKKLGDPEFIRTAQEQHDNYVEVCRKADRMICNIPK